MKLLYQVRRVCRTKHLSLRTEKAYVMGRGVAVRSPLDTV